MNEQCFDLSLEKVETYEAEGEGLEVGGRRGQQEVENRMDYERSDILNQEDCAPCNLRTYCNGQFSVPSRSCLWCE